MSTKEMENNGEFDPLTPIVVLLALLKLTGVISISWMWVVAPWIAFFTVYIALWSYYWACYFSS